MLILTAATVRDRVDFTDKYRGYGYDVDDMSTTQLPDHIKAKKEDRTYLTWYF